jgi:hypothetical protein
MVRSASLAAAAFMLACNQVDLCRWHSEMVPGDGGVARCLRADDCPLEADAVVCDNDGPPDKNCVQCVGGACQKMVGESCQ